MFGAYPSLLVAQLLGAGTLLTICTLWGQTEGKNSGFFIGGGGEFIEYETPSSWADMLPSGTESFIFIGFHGGPKLSSGHISRVQNQHLLGLIYSVQASSLLKLGQPGNLQIFSVVLIPWFINYSVSVAT